MVVDAVSYLLSGVAIGAIRGAEQRLVRGAATPVRFADVVDGWRYIFSSPALRPLFLNTVIVNALMLASAPLVAVLMLGRLGFAPWEYGLAFAVPCLGGLVGARLAQPLVARLGEQRVMVGSGEIRAFWSVGMAFIPAGAAGIAVVMLVQFGLLTSLGVFNPVSATYRLERTADRHLARTLSAWMITGNAMIAALTAVWGIVASLVGLRPAIAIAGLLLLATPLLLRFPKEARRLDEELEAGQAAPSP